MTFKFLEDHAIPSTEFMHARPNGARADDYARVVNLPLAYVGSTVLVRAGGRLVGVVHSGDSTLDMDALASALGVGDVAVVRAEEASSVAGVAARAISPLTLWKKAEILWDSRVLRLPTVCLPTESDERSVRLDTRQLRKAATAKAAVAKKTAVTPASSAYDVLLERGFIERVSDEAVARSLLARSDVGVYNGFDPTADSLHVGSLVPIMALANVQRAGRRVVALVGGATGLIGDPSGKTELRSMLTRELIAVNMRGISGQLASYLDLSTDRGALVDNADWFASIGALEFLRELGPHFSINQMLKSESVRSRMAREGEGLTYLELTYMLLQAYDFVRLAEDRACLVQTGGSDQWGNICAGIDLGRRATGSTLFGRAVKASDGLAGVTFPLLTKASGGKFGKSEAGNVWLSADRTAIYDFFQFWRNTDDADLERFLGLFTLLPMDEVTALAAAGGAAGLNRAKEVLAFAVTSLRHGVAKAASAVANARALFGGYDDSFKGDVVRLGLAGEADLASPSAAAAADAGATSVQVAAGAVAGGAMAVVDALVALGLASSKSDGRRLIKGGGVYVEGERVEAVDAKLPAAAAGSKITVRVGKKKHGIIEILA